MQNSQHLEDSVRSAVKVFANCINSISEVADMSALVKVTSDLPLENLDYWERLIRSEFSTGFTESSTPTWTFWSKPKPKAILTWLDLISCDGRKREKSLRTLSGAAPNAFFFSLALRRLNDWVPQVREAAKSKLPEIAEATNPQHIVDALYVALLHWNSWGRITKAERDVLLRIVSDQKIAELFRYKLINSTSGPMRSLLSQLVRTSILDDSLEEIAKVAIQPSVRAKAYRSLLERRVTWLEGYKWQWADPFRSRGKFKPVMSERTIKIQLPLADLIKRSAADRSSVVRRISAEFLIRELENLGDSAQELAAEFASDKSRPVSERGVFALRKLEEMKGTKIL